MMVGDDAYFNCTTAVLILMGDDPLREVVEEPDALLV